jgi:excisionase family DNA binding protein
MGLPRGGRSMPKCKRSYNLRLIKATWPYTVQEVAALFGVHKNAVLRWLNDGLQANRDRRPFLIRGNELIRFLTERKTRKKQKCAWNECFCFKCQAPRVPYLGIIDVVIESSTRFRLKALCNVCGTSMNKVQAIENLQRVRQCFQVQQLEVRHLKGCAGASINSDLETVP